MKRFPYNCTVKETGEKFTPTIIDYDNQEVGWQKSQVSDDLHWYGFDEVEFEEREDFIPLAKNKK